MARQRKGRGGSGGVPTTLLTLALFAILLVGLGLFITVHWTDALHMPEVPHGPGEIARSFHKALRKVQDAKLGAAVAPGSGQHAKHGKHGARKTLEKSEEVAGWRPHIAPVHFDLNLPKEVLEEPAMRSHEAMFRQYGFNLNLSNHLPLARDVPDMRNPECQARTWPPHEQLPKATVIVIFYNEALSTLLRNVVGILNRSPPELLGEILLIDDNSNLPQLSLLPGKLKELEALLPPGKVRLVRRDIHNGIVGARNRGVQEALYPVVVILDSHAEVTPGWLEPLVSRIAEDRTRVVVPNIIAMNIDALTFDGGQTWPPLRGAFNWRLGFNIVPADPVKDIIEPEVDKRCSAIKTPIMPGGLFAMDREYFLKLGMYDPEILFYGGEHIEMSLRIWMCGGSMEINVCSHIGHIYREFDRFGVDTQLKGININTVLDRNDARVAEVWLDGYKDLYYKYRKPPSGGLGDVKSRQDLRKQLKCKPFEWFLREVCRDFYLPDARPLKKGQLAVGSGSGKKRNCLSNRGGGASLERCSGAESQELELTKDGRLQFASMVGQDLVCLRALLVSQTRCEVAPQWLRRPSGEIELADQPGRCLGRGGGPESLDLEDCNGSEEQRWSVAQAKDGGFTLSDKDRTACVDNMQREDVPGLYSCHSGQTQQWKVPKVGEKPGKIYRAFGDEICLGLRASLRVTPCAPSDANALWQLEEDPISGALRIESAASPGSCLHWGEEGELDVRNCEDVGVEEHQLWQWRTH